MPARGLRRDPCRAGRDRRADARRGPLQGLGPRQGAAERGGHRLPADQRRAHAGGADRLGLGLVRPRRGRAHGRGRRARRTGGDLMPRRDDIHKILLIVGPTRAGKGVTARIMSALVGAENVAGPTLSSLNGDFGLAPLLGKTLAIVSDARLSGRGAHVVVERLLSVSGEDSLTVNRKFREQWSGKLPTRLVLCSNELPQLGDASMAIAGRFVPLLLTRSWLGKEDHQLETALRAELPSILLWSCSSPSCSESRKVPRRSRLARRCEPPVRHHRGAGERPDDCSGGDEHSCRGASCRPEPVPGAGTGSRVRS